MSTAGQAVGGIVGAVGGFLIGGPQGALYGAQIGMMVGGYLDPPKGPKMFGPRLNDLSVQTSTYGAIIPRLYGTAAIHGNVLWLEGNALKEHVTTTKNKSGGKGGGKSAGTTTTYTYSATFAVGLCKGPIVGIRRLWIANELVYDAGSSDPAVIQASNALVGGWKLYPGSDTQAADHRIQADKGAANTPAWPGLAYIVLYDLDLTAKYNNSLAAVQIKAEICTGTAQSTFIETCAAMGWESNRAEFGCVVHNGRIKVLGGHVGAVGWGTSVYGDVWETGDAGIWRKATGEVLGDPALFSGSTGRGSFGCAVLNGTIYCVGGQVGDKTHGATVVNETASSADGESWSIDATAPWEARYRPSVCVHDGALYMAGGDSVTHHQRDVWRMSPGGSWNLVTDNAPWVAAGGTGRANAGFVSLNGYLYILSGYGDPAMPGLGYRDVWRSSDDGATWTQICTDYHSDGPFMAHGANPSVVVWGGEIWIIRPSSDNTDTTLWTEAWHSADGISWTHETLTSYPPFRDGGRAVIFNNSLFYVGGVGAPDTWLLAYRVMTPGTVPLSTIVASECLASALLASGDINATALTSSVRGFTVSSAGSIRSALEVLQGAFPFDALQAGYKVKFIPRGGSSVVAIAEGDLDARRGGDKPKDKLPMTREMESQLPRRVSVSYPDVDREYDTNEQGVERITSDAVNETRLDMAIVLNADEAARVADVLISLYWLERYEVGPFTLPPTFRSLEPGDVVTVTFAGHAYDIRLTRIEYGAGGILTCQGRFASAAIYSSTVSGSAGSANAGVPLSLAGPSDCWMLDLPCLAASQNTWGETAAVAGVNAGWKSAILYRSDDSGQSYDTIQGFSLGAKVFRATSILPAGRTDLPDVASTLTVTPASTGAALFSGTYADLLNGFNLAAFGAPGRWEIINFKTVTAGSGTALILSDFSRGLFGTEWAMTAHAVGDILVLLDYSAVSFVGVPPAAYLSPRLWRAVTLGAEFNDYVDIVETYRGANLKPLAPVGLSGGLNSATNDFAITWTRRTRLGGAWINGIDAPVSETSEAYEIEIWDSAFIALKRTLTASSPSVTYTAAMATADFGAPKMTLGVIVYQISSVIGRGYPAKARITSPLVDAFQSSARLMMHFDGAEGGTVFADSFGQNGVASGSPVTVQTPEPQFGTASGKFGSNGYITPTPCPFTGIANGSKYTWEFRFKVLTWVNGTDHNMICFICGSQMVFGAQENGGFIELFFALFGSGWPGLHGVTAVPTTDTNWHHVEVDCDGTNTYLFCDGALIASMVGAVNIGSTGPYHIGERSGGVPAGQWLIKEHNLIVGNNRHTTAFTPPSAPYNY